MTGVRIKRAVLFLTIIIVVSVLAGWFGGRWLLSFSVADYTGNLTISGVAHPVEVTFDAKGVPQVWAQTDGDAWFTLGWLHASERLFQMETVRRLVYGELSEVFGKSTVDTDIRQRQFGYARQGKRDAKELDAATRQVIQRYCDGINAWITGKFVLPPEFILSGISPRPWTVEDVCAQSIYQTWFSHRLRDWDRPYDQLLREVGDELLPVLQAIKPWSPTTVHESVIKQLFPEEDLPERSGEASNTWAVAPQKSVSGSALHASDPHLPVGRAPGFWYIAGLHSADGLNVVGVSSPGVPIIAMGHNGQSAWSFTVAAVDLVDYYIEKRNPDNRLEVLRDSGYVPVTVHVEEIRVNGEESPRKVPVYQTGNGPAIEETDSTLITMKWAGFDFSASGMMSSGIQLHRVSAFEEFRQIVTGFGALDANWMYTDKAGNIGYQLGAPIPLRDDENTFVPRPAEASRFKWNGYRKLDETPHLYNPPEGWAASCNNQIVSADWPFRIPGYYDPYRIKQATEWLTSKSSYSLADFGRYQMDQTSVLAQRWKSLMGRGAEHSGESALGLEIYAWDGKMSTDSRMAALFAIWWESLTRAMFEDDLGEEWALGGYIQEEVLTANMSRIIDDQRIEGTVEDAAGISAIALQYARERADGRTWGEISTLTIEHPFARVKLLGVPLMKAWLDLNRGPFPFGGDHASLNANFNSFDNHSSKFSTHAGPSMRYLLDWADVDGFTINSNLGQSGNPLSPHYDDFLYDMLDGKRWNVPFSKERVYEKKTSLLRLIPEAE